MGVIRRFLDWGRRLDDQARETIRTAPPWRPPSRRSVMVHVGMVLVAIAATAVLTASTSNRAVEIVSRLGSSAFVTVTLIRLTRWRR